MCAIISELLTVAHSVPCSPHPNRRQPGSSFTVCQICTVNLAQWLIVLLSALHSSIPLSDDLWVLNNLILELRMNKQASVKMYEQHSWYMDLSIFFRRHWTPLLTLEGRGESGTYLCIYLLTMSVIEWVKLMKCIIYHVAIPGALIVGDMEAPSSPRGKESWVACYCFSN